MRRRLVVARVGQVVVLAHRHLGHDHAARLVTAGLHLGQVLLDGRLDLELEVLGAVADGPKDQQQQPGQKQPEIPEQLAK